MKKFVFAFIVSVFLCASGFAPYDDSRKVPVIMYHSVCKTNVGEYVVSPDALRSDFKYLKDKGYTAVFVSDIIDYCDGKADLPPKPVLLTFDDGFFNNAYYAEKIAAEYGMKITVSVVGSYVAAEDGKRKRSPVYSYLNREELSRLGRGKIVEIANHTYDMHHTSPRKGVRRKKGESAEDYKNAIIADSEKCRELIKESCGYSTEVFTYPFGCYSGGTNEILHSLGYRAILTCKGGINVFRKGSAEGLDRIMRYNRSGHISTEKFFSSVMRI